ncbi:MAG: hypothetical protein FD180_4485 [Planctomycetota bacterium]|nr:MAG: hypothetical protein FD180_4485 [Planctomycetota bacterium]
MNAKAYFAGILTGGLFVLAGYLMGHSSPMAHANAPGDAASGYIMTAAPSGANEKLIYIWDTTDPTKPRLSVYALEQGKELQLRAHRNCQFDKLWDSYEIGGKAESPLELKKRFDAEKPK